VAIAVIKFTPDPIAEAIAKGKTENFPNLGLNIISEVATGIGNRRREFWVLLFFYTERKKERKNRETQTRASCEGKTVCSRTEPKDLLFTCSCEDPNLLLLLPLLGSALSGLSSILTRQLLHGSILILAQVFPARIKVPLFLRN